MADDNIPGLIRVAALSHETTPGVFELRRARATSSGETLSWLASQLAGEENIGSANAMLRTRKRCNATKLTAITAVTIGAGAAADTVLHGILIEANTTAVTATIAGFGNEAGAATEAQNADWATSKLQSVVDHLVRLQRQGLITHMTVAEALDAIDGGRKAA